MKFAAILTLTWAAFVVAAPNLEKRLTCQACNVDGLTAGDACCSAHCLISDGDWHGGHCDSDGYCICN